MAQPSLSSERKDHAPAEEHVRSELMKIFNTIAISIYIFLLISCAPVQKMSTTQQICPLEVVYRPLTLEDVPQELIEQLNFPYVRFYRTDVTNNTDRPIKIIWFESYFDYGGVWMSSNVRNKVLRTNDFMDWYSRDDMTTDGWLRPGGTASCLVNWHWTDTPKDIASKWAYIGIDKQGNDYLGEEVVPKIKPIKFR